jgi:hypothetical protein
MSEIDISIDRLAFDVESSTLKTDLISTVSLVELEAGTRDIALNGIKTSVSVQSVERSIDLVPDVQTIELIQYDLEFKGPVRELLVRVSPDSGNTLENRGNGLFITPQWGSVEW